MGAPFANLEDGRRESAILDIVRPVGPRRTLPGFGCMDLTALLFPEEHTMSLHKMQDHSMRQFFCESLAELLEREPQMLGHLLTILRGHIDILIPAMLLAAVSALSTFKIHIFVFQLPLPRLSVCKRRSSRTRANSTRRNPRTVSAGFAIRSLTTIGHEQVV